MNKCFICGESALKKNSHLIPWFLIKHVVTKNGSGIRDTEMCFSIDPSSFNEMYTGRGILPEYIDDSLSSIERLHKNPFSRDNILCLKCENKIGRLESNFSIKFSKTRMDELCKASSKNENTIKIHKEEQYSYSLFQLFLQSIFIRCSVGEYETMQLSSSISNKIKENLNHAFMVENFEKIHSHTNVELIHNIPISVIYLNYSKFHDSTKNFILVNKSKNPYQIIAGNWIFQLYESFTHLLNCKEWLYGLRIKLIEILSNTLTEKVSQIILLDCEMSIKFNNNLIEDVTETRKINLRRHIRLLYSGMFNIKPTIEISQFIEYHFYDKFKSNTDYTRCLIDAFLELKKINEG